MYIGYEKNDTWSGSAGGSRTVIDVAHIGGFMFVNVGTLGDDYFFQVNPTSITFNTDPLTHIGTATHYSGNSDDRPVHQSFWYGRFPAATADVVVTVATGHIKLISTNIFSLVGASRLATPYANQSAYAWNDVDKTESHTTTDKLPNSLFFGAVMTIDYGGFTEDAGATLLHSANRMQTHVKGLVPRESGTVSITYNSSGAMEAASYAAEILGGGTGSQVIMIASRIQELYNEMRSGRTPSDELVRRYRELTNTLRPMEGSHDLAI